MKIQILALLLQIVAPILYNITTSCDNNSSSYYSSIQAKCISCDDTKNLISSQNHSYCICKRLFAPSNYSVINPASMICTNQSAEVCSGGLDIVNIDGTYYSSPYKCLICTGGWKTDIQSIPQCIYCGPGYTSINSGTDCKCNQNLSEGIGGCYDINSYGINSANSYGKQLPKALVGCYLYQDQLSCSFLMNLCVFSLLDMSSGSICASLATQNQSYLFLNNIPNTFTLSISQSLLTILMVRYLPTGNYVDSKSFSFSDVSICGVGNIPEFRIGSNIHISCSYNFNNILNTLSSSNFSNSNYVYSMFLKDKNGNYQLVPAYINNVPISRFFLIDTFSSQYTNQLTYLSSITFQITLNSNNQLVLPKLILKYLSLPIILGSSFSNPINTVSLSFVYTYDLINYNKIILGIFIAVNIVAFIHIIIRTYIGYLNKRSFLVFFLFFIQTWSSYMFILLLCVSGYWFFFTKTTASIFVIMPQDQSFYVAFYVVFGIMIFFRLVATFYQKSDSLNTEVYLIDWEKGQEKNSWRQMFIINSFVQFYSYRTVSFFWIMAWTVFFLVGLNWELHSLEVTQLSISNNGITPMNTVLLYFLSTSILMTVGIVFKALRRISVIWWPYPFENFLDFCCLANLSIFFAKKNYPIGYYLHASSPNHSETNFKEINQQLTKGLQIKNRNFLNDAIAQTNNFQCYIVYMHNQFENKLAQIRRTQDSQQFQPIKPLGSNVKPGYKKIPFNIREQFSQKYIKKLLNTIPQERNQLMQKTFIQSLIGFPPINLNQNRQLPTFLADQAYELTGLFPNSNELRDLVTYTMLFSMFNLLTMSSAISGFLAYLIMQVIVEYIVSKYARRNIQRFTKVKEGFMM